MDPDQARPATPNDVLALLDGSFASAALGAAMELGLFWLLEAEPLDTRTIARALGIPPIRCEYWLQILQGTGLIERDASGYRPSDSARRSILEVFGRDTWALLAEEARQRLPSLQDLSIHLRDLRSARERPDLPIPTAYEKIALDPEAARRFTRMLYEIHRPLAGALAASLDLRGAERVMDLGGGSGVVSLALAARHPEIALTVVDLATVCAAGREIAAENDAGQRVAFHAADFLNDDLPSGFDVVLECDVNLYSDALFRRVRASLNPGGRFIVVDQFAPEEGVAPSTRAHWALEGSMVDPGFVFPTAAGVRLMLERTGFVIQSDSPLAVPSERCVRFSEGMQVIEARTS